MKTLLPLLFIIILIFACSKKSGPVTDPEFCWECTYTTYRHTPEYIAGGHHYHDTTEVSFFDRHYCDLSEKSIGYIQEDYTCMNEYALNQNVTITVYDSCKCEKIIK